MKIHFVERKNEIDTKQKSFFKESLFVNVDIMNVLDLKKGSIIWYKNNQDYLLYSLDDEYDPLVWKSPEAFIDSIADFIEEDIARYGRS